jgi:hypothetical protein
VTNSLSTPLGPTNNRFLQATQGSQFWTHCGCGGSPDVFRRTLDFVFDTVHTGNDLGLEITVRAGAYDFTNDCLWLHGSRDDVAVGTFLIVNTFDRNVRGLTYDGESFWALVTLVSRSICRIDPETARVVESFELPDEDVSWTGLEVDDTHMYLIGTASPQQEGVLMRLEKP